MVDLRWDGDDFRNEQDSSGSTADLVSHSGKLQQGYNHGSLTEGLVAYYPMEKGEGEVLHDGALDNLGQINGSTWVSGQIGSNALSINGSNQYVDIGNINRLRSEVTVSAWYKTNESPFSDYRYILGMWDGSERPIELEAWQDNDGFRWFITAGGTEEVLEVSGFVNSNEWQHVTATYDGSKLKLYSNGNLQGTLTHSQGGKIDGLPDNGWIGWRPSKSQVPWDGAIEELRIFDRALSEPEIQALYNLSKPSGTQVSEKKVPSQDQGGVSRYMFNGDLTDSWGSNDGTDNTTVSPSYVTGIYGQAKNFDVTDDYVDTGSKFSEGVLNTNNWTISLWFNPRESSSSDYKYSLIDNYDGSFPQVSIQHNFGDLLARVRDGSNEIQAVDSGVPDEGKWKHTVVVRKGAECLIYSNGNLAGKDSNSDTNADLTNADLYIGERPDGSGDFDGKIDDVRIYNTALTPKQVEKLYHKGAYRVPRESTLQ